MWKLEYERSGGLMGSWYTCEGGEDWVSLAPRMTRGKESLLGTVLQGKKLVIIHVFRVAFFIKDGSL